MKSMLIDIKKKYKTRSGLPVRILCTDLQDTDYPVVAVIGSGVFTYTEYGEEYIENERRSQLDLVEYNPWVDLKIDHPIIVEGNNRHFHYYKDGYVYFFPYGCSSYTAKAESQCISVTLCEIPLY